MDILNNDIQFGKQSEDKLFTTLENKWQGLKKAELQYSPYDFYTKEHKFELKTRRCAMRDYPTTIIPKKKTEQAGKLIFLFCFTDKLAFIEYNKEKFANYKIKNIEYVRAFGKITSVPHIHIPVEDLVEIEMTHLEQNNV